MSHPYSQAPAGKRQKEVISLESLIQRSVHGESIDSLSLYVLAKRAEKQEKGLDFEGPTLGEAISCVDAYFDSDELPSVDQKFLSTIAWYCKLFLAKFFLQGQGILNSTCRMPQLDLYKKCDKALQHMLESTKQIDEVDRDLYLCYGGKFSKVKDLKYLTKKWILLSIGGEEEEPTLIYKKDWVCSCYSPLFKAMILSINKVTETLKVASEDTDVVRQYDQICNNILSVGRLYQLFNPSKGELDEAGDALKDLLTSPDKGGEKSPYHENALQQVKELFDDCARWLELEPKAEIPGNREAREELHSIKYCKQFARALSKVRKKGFYFTEEDYYLSNKSDPARNPKFNALESSLLKSGFEYDPWKGCGFDTVTGYESHYLSKEEALELGTRELHAVTRMITNPSKCKGRGIHLAYNAIQDRCNLIHRVLQEFLNELSTDCTTHQTRGVQFLLARSIRKKRAAEGYNLYASDFTNATDTLSQFVQELVLSFIFPKEIVEFWHNLASMPKQLLYHLSKKKVLYTQASGQPQGFLGSFDAFALVHHVIMLCTMKVMGLGDREASDFYRVLGDDSAICTITHDGKCPQLESLKSPSYEPMWGRSVLDTYFCMCLWSNFICNFDKTTVVFSDTPVALIDFAKVTIREGRIFSPIPVRLFFSTFKKNEATTIPGFLWNADHQGWVNISHLRSEVTRITNLPDWFIDDLYFSGVIPCFSHLEIEDEQRDELTLGKVALAYILASIQQNICFSFLHDSIKEAFVRGNNSSRDFYKIFVTSSKKARQQFEDLISLPNLSSKHKLFYALLKNKDIEECLTAMYKGILDLPDSVLWSPYLEVTATMRDSIVDLSHLIEVTRANPDAINVKLLGSLKPILDSLKEWDKYTFRSDYKKAKAFSSLASTSKEAFDRLFENPSNVGTA